MPSARPKGHPRSSQPQEAPTVGGRIPVPKAKIGGPLRGLEPSVLTTTAGFTMLSWVGPTLTPTARAAYGFG